MSLRVIRCAGTYQGYPIKAVSYRRTDTLNPDFGHVEMDYESIGPLVLEVNRKIPWRPAQGNAVPSPLSIQGWFDGVHNTITELPEVKPPAGKLGLFGDLVLNCSVDGSDRPAIRYRDIYLDDSGIEELLDDLANVREHKRGTLRVPITDIRKFYGDFGAAIQRINCTLPSGEPDSFTLKNGLEAWEPQEVIPWLFSQLPGSPIVVRSSEIFGLKLPPPIQLIVEAQPGSVRAHLGRLLEEYRLVPKFLRNSSYSVDRKGSNVVSYGFVAETAGKPRAIAAADLLSYERKTVTWTNRPWAVQVFGRPPIRRITLVYVPIFQDTDRRYRRLQDVETLWGYPYAEVGRQIFVGHEKNFKNVPPTSGRPPHQDRRRIMQKWAFRGYAPAYLFDPKRVDEKGIPYFTDKDAQRVFFLPMEDFGVKESELGEAKPGDGKKPTTTIPRDDNNPGLGPWRIIPPIVRAKQIGEGFYRDWKTLERHFEALLESLQLQTFDAVRIREQAIEFEKDRQAKVKRDIEALKKPKEKDLLDRIGAGYAKWLDRGFKALNPDSDYVSAGFVGYGALDVKAMKDAQAAMEAKSKSLEQQLQAHDADTLEAKKIELQVKEKLDKSKIRYQSFKEQYEQSGGLQLKHNLPYAMIPEGAYHLDRETGIVLFQEPACHMNEPFVLDGDSAANLPEGLKETATGVIADGGVVVTFGYEVKANTTGDLTSVLWTPDPDAKNDEQQPVVAAINRSTVAGARIMTSPQMRMWQMDLGTPLNLAEVIRDSMEGAAPLMGPPIVDGFIYEFSGFLPIELVGGINMVQYEWKEAPTKGRFTPGRTHVYVNAPNSPGPLGSARFAYYDPAAPVAGMLGGQQMSRKELE